MKNGQSRETCNIGYTRHITKTSKSKNTTQKAKKMSNTHPTEIRVRTHVLVKGKQSLLIIHPTSSSYIQSSQVNVLAVITERKNLCKQ